MLRADAVKQDDAPAVFPRGVSRRSGGQTQAQPSVGPLASRTT
jgi:hypothetical protein